MSNVYQFPKGSKVGRHFILKPVLKLGAASFCHYATLTPMLLVSRFRFPLLILGAAYVINFFYSNHHSLWTGSDHTGLYAILALCVVLLNELLVIYVERSKPFHRIFRVRGKIKEKENGYAANDE